MMLVTFLNMKDYRHYDVDSTSILYANISFVFIVGLLIYNILIAMITDTVETVYEN